MDFYLTEEILKSTKLGKYSFSQLENSMGRMSHPANAFIKAGAQLHRRLQMSYVIVSFLKKILSDWGIDLNALDPDRIPVGSLLHSETSKKNHQTVCG